MGENRNHTRVPYRIPVFFGTEGTPYAGFVTNLSEGGVAIKSRTVYKPGTALNLMLKPESFQFMLEGEVRWSYRPNFPVGIDGNFDMGIMFTEANSEYQQYFEDLKGNFKDLRKDFRFEKVFKVVFKTPNEFIKAYTQNLSLGGLYIATEEPLEKDSIIDVEIDLIDIDEVIRVGGKVVFVADQKTAGRMGLNAGVGVEIIEYYEDSKQKFQSYLKQLHG